MTPEPALTDDALATLAHRACQALPDAPTAVQRFDSWALPPQALGMRGGVDHSRHLLFSAADRDVDLRITRQPTGGWSLAGQVLGPDETGHISLLPASGASAGHRASLDALAEFHLDGVAAGQWCLRLETTDQVVALPTIDVGGRRPV